MKTKDIAHKHYQRVADDAVTHSHLRVPPEGWLRTIRKALNMSGAQLAGKMGITRARVAQAESAELSGGATLNSMQNFAKAMGCRFVYAVVPEKSIENIIALQAKKKAIALVKTASTHMALESQNLPDEKITAEVERLAHDLVHNMPPDFWSDE